VKKDDKPKKNKLFLSLTFIALGFISILLYTIWDNNWINLANQVVTIDKLPDSFQDFKVLVLSDLHGKRFGDQQQKLLELNRPLDFDAVFIAGDMQEGVTSGFEPLIEIIEGLPQEVPVYYVGGNWGPFDFDPITGEVLEAGQILQSLGVLLLTQPIRMDRGEDHIWFVPGFSYANNQKWLTISESQLNTELEALDQMYYSQTLEYQSLLLNGIKTIPDDDVLIGLTHIPIAKEALDSLDDHPPYDLVIAGHFHGGQIRLPLIGALYVPDNNSRFFGFFPDNRYISGLYVGKATQQYVSRGLGSNGIIPLLKFRLFNTPEMDLITLKRSK
jgi:predicted MPP superfamily phosphohydrolase